MTKKPSARPTGLAGRYDPAGWCVFLLGIFLPTVTSWLYDDAALRQTSETLGLTLSIAGFVFAVWFAPLLDFPARHPGNIGSPRKEARRLSLMAWIPAGISLLALILSPVVIAFDGFSGEGPHLLIFGAVGFTIALAAARILEKRHIKMYAGFAVRHQLCFACGYAIGPTGGGSCPECGFRNPSSP